MALPILDGNQTAATLSTVLTSGEHIPAHTVVSLGSQAITDVRSAVSGSVVSISNFPASQSTTFGAVTGSVSVLNFPSTQTIAGTVTANGFDFNNSSYEPIPLAPFDENASGGRAVVAKIVDDNGVGLNFSVGVPISGTVTANNPNGELITRFGSVATANLAFITSAVTNTSRKYLLAQNISSGTVTIGIGFSPTTTQGIQLTAGAGLTFDSFCPTGAIFWLGAVTGAAFTILEG